MIRSNFRNKSTGTNYLPRPIHIMSFFAFVLRSLFRLSVLPRHVAFIMDGNRRFASKHGKKIDDGHTGGYKKLIEIVMLSQLLGIEEITVFAFSTDNFRRAKSQRTSFFRLMEDKFRKMESLSRENRLSCKVRFVGDLETLPFTLRKSMTDLTEETRKNKGVSLNICFSYSSDSEATSATLSIRENFVNKRVAIDQIADEALREKISEQFSIKPDLMVRTSGENRISDFLLWHCHAKTQIFFEKKMWPAFSMLDYIKILLQYGEMNK
ncbi:hypothetical protein MHBO_003587 [Bonamia ostreae]|uniref:Alkyl transferase n=1 Tax=Bonamia ostreae TaxID=126728 RepID=A0ABV2AQW6_9EUKA